LNTALLQTMLRRIQRDHASTIHQMKSSAPPVLLRLGLAMASFVAISRGQTREHILLDDHWWFHPGDVAGAQEESFQDQKWRVVNLPHDWSIEQTTDAKEPASGGGGFFPTGVGCYRRTFSVPESWKDQRVWIEFEGVYQRAEVSINGYSLGMHPYGYTPFTHDLTPHLKTGADNTIFVRVDNSRQPNSRWYSGSGIYRHVWLNVANPVHLSSDGTFIATPEVSENAATVEVRTVVRNQSELARSIEIEIDLIDPADQSAATLRIEDQAPADSERPHSLKIALPKPALWSAETPALYTAVTRLRVDGEVTDQISTRFGIRSIEVSADQGFRLNGRPVNLVGGNVHHDNGPLGAAAFDRAEERRVEILKAAGFNAIRTSHNPPSTAFLEACDRLGMLVIAEAFDGWAKKKTRHDYAGVFKEWWGKDLDAMVLRDRNHPSVVMWSIGNEVYERGAPEGARIARRMRERIRTLDTSRPITAGINGLGESGDWTTLDPLFASLDVAGYNYETARHAKDHARLPSRTIMLAETYQSDIFPSWAVVEDNAHVVGEFVWSALDYLGEAGIGRVYPPGEKALPHWEGNHFPWHGAACGDIDITGWRKPVSHYRNIVWARGETLYASVIAPSPTGKEWSLSKWSMAPALPSWTWPGHDGRPLQIEVYSRHDAARVYLNDKLIGEKPTTRNNQFRTVFSVPYEPGTLRVAGLEDDVEVDEVVLTTAGKAAHIRLLPERKQIRADGQDLCFVNVEIVDEPGRLRPDADHSLRYRLQGPGEIIGIGSGDLTSQESYQANPRRTHQGRALVIIRSTGKRGTIRLTASSSKLSSGETTVLSEMQD